MRCGSNSNIQRTHPVTEPNLLVGRIFTLHPGRRRFDGPDRTVGRAKDPELRPPTPRTSDPKLSGHPGPDPGPNPRLKAANLHIWWI